jgi:hypothetical protein
MGTQMLLEFWKNVPMHNDLHYASFVIKIIQFTQFEPSQKYVFIVAKN